MAYDENKAAEVIKAHVAQAIERAENIGGKAQWSTSKHLAMLADIIGAFPSDDTLEVLERHYNISAFQQRLAKAGSAKGHFQRTGRVQSADDYIADLLK